MNENEFEYKGVTYVAIDSYNQCKCYGCAFLNVDNCDKSGIPPCNSGEGYNGKDVIFVEKQPC